MQQYYVCRIIFAKIPPAQVPVCLFGCLSIRQGRMIQSQLDNEKRKGKKRRKRKSENGGLNNEERGK